MKLTIKEYQKRITEIIKRLRKEGKEEEIEKEIRKFKEKYEPAVPGELLIRQTASKQEEEFIGKYTISKIFSKGIKEIKDNIEEEVVDIVMKGIRRNLTDEEIENKIRKTGKAWGGHARNLRNTVEIAYNRATSLDIQRKAGFEFFRLVGPVLGARQWCKDHIDKVYTIEEIEKLNNGQGLAVREFAGGYNCRHHWEGVRNEVAYVARIEVDNVHWLNPGSATEMKKFGLDKKYVYKNNAIEIVGEKKEVYYYKDVNNKERLLFKDVNGYVITNKKGNVFEYNYAKDTEKIIKIYQEKYKNFKKVS